MELGSGQRVAGQHGVCGFDADDPRPRWDRPALLAAALKRVFPENLCVSHAAFVSDTA